MTTTDVRVPKRADNPYVGPEAFRRGQRFYGRDRETADLLDLLIAERIVLLHSPSGAGKSSLVAAGLIPMLEAEGFEVLPVVRVNHDALPGEGPTAGKANRYVLSTLLSLSEELPPEHQHHIDELRAMTIAKYLAQWPDLDQRPGNEVLIFDQFEEIITADLLDHDVKAAFFADVGTALRDRNLWALFSIREDFLAELDPYANLVPTRFANRYRLDLLPVDQALEAMIRPAADLGTDFRPAAAQKLVDDLRRVRVQRPRGVTEELGATVEPVQLQVACRQVWNRLDKSTHTIDLDDIGAIGNVDQALASYYAECAAGAATEAGIGERVIRDWFEQELITPQGIRNQVLQGPGHGGPAVEKAVKLLTSGHLVRAESRRGATWFELAHDRLINPVKEDNARWRDEHLSYVERLATWWDEQGRPDQALLLGPDLAVAEQWAGANPESLSVLEREFLVESRKVAGQAERERRANRRTKRWLVAAIAAGLVAGLFAGWAGVAQQRAHRLAVAAEVSGLAGQASGVVGADVDLGLLLAQEAAKLSDDPINDESIQRALQFVVDQSPVMTVLSGHGPADSVVFSDDGTRVATHHSEDASVVVWDASSGKELYALPDPDEGLFGSLQFSPDGTELAAIPLESDLAIWSASPHAEPKLIDVEGIGLTRAVAFSPDGTRLATVGNGLSVVDPSGAVSPRFDGSLSVDLDGSDVAWTPDGTLVVAGGDGSVSVWDSETGRHMRDLSPHPGEVFDVEVSPSGSQVASVSLYQVVLADLSSGQILHTVEGLGITAASFSADEARLVVVDGFGTATIIDPSQDSLMGTTAANGMLLLSVDVDPTNPDRAVVASGKGDPAIWNVAIGHTDFESAMASFSGGVITSSYDGSLAVWSHDLTHRQVLPASDDPIQDASVSAAGDLVSLTRTSGAVEVWTVVDTRQVFASSLGSDATAVALSPDGESVAAGGADGHIVVWDVMNGTELRSLEEHTDGIVALDYGSGSNQLASASSDGTARVWDLDLNQVRHVLRTGTTPTTLDLNNPGTRLAVGGEDGSVQFWDPESGDRLRGGTGDGHAHRVNDLDFNVVGDQLVSAASDRFVIIWDATTGAVVERIQRSNEAWRVAFSADGEHILVGQGAGAPRDVTLGGAELLRLAETKATRELSARECRVYLRNVSDCPEE